MNTLAITVEDQVIQIKAKTFGSKSGISNRFSLEKSVKSTTVYYKLQLSENFDCKIRNGGKLTGKFPGLSGGYYKTNTGGIPNPKDLNRGWSVRPIYRGYGCKLMLYVYHLNMPDLKPGKNKVYGDNLELLDNPIKLTPGQKYQIKLYVKMNDVGKKNGIIKLWVDDTLSAVYENIEFRNNQPNSGIIDEVRYSVFNGGGKNFKLDRDVSLSIFDLHTE